MQDAIASQSDNVVGCHSVMLSHCASLTANTVVDAKDAGCDCLLRSHDSADQHLCCSKLQKSAALSDP